MRKTFLLIFALRSCSAQFPIHTHKTIYLCICLILLIKRSQICVNSGTRRVLEEANLITSTVLTM